MKEPNLKSGKQSGHQDIPSSIRIADNTWDKVGRAVPCLLGSVQFPAEYKRHWFAPLVFWGIRNPAGLRRGVGEYLAFCFSRWRGTYCLKTSPDYHMVKDCFSIHEPCSLRDGERRNFPKDKQYSCLSYGSVSCLSCGQHKTPLEKEQAELAVWQNMSVNHRSKELLHRFIAVL